MSNVVALSFAEHRGLRVDPRPAAALGDAQRFVPLIVDEFPLAAMHSALLFTKDSETGAFMVGAMMGFDPGENLLLSKGGFEGYRPLNLRRVPFFVAGDALAIDLDNPRVGKDGELLFAEDGRPSRFLQEIADTLRQLREGSARTQSFIQTLLKLELIEPVEISLRFDDGEARDLKDIYTIAHHSLRSISDTAALELFRSGSLYLVHLLIGSLNQVAVLAKRRNDALRSDFGARGAGVL